MHTHMHTLTHTHPTDKRGCDPGGPPIHGALWVEPVSSGGANPGEYPTLFQSWYVDDFSTEGSGSHIKPAISHIDTLGPIYGFFLEQER